MAELYELPGDANDGMDWYTRVFSGTSKEERYYWYNLLLFAGRNQDFNTPAEIDLSILFNNGFPRRYDVEITKEEEVFLEQHKNTLGEDVVKLPVELMNQVLLEHTGYTLDQTNGVGLDSMLYYEPTDSYFMNPRGAAGATGVSVICASTDDNGSTIHMICTADGAYLRLKLLDKDNAPDAPYYVQSCYEIEPCT